MNLNIEIIPTKKFKHIDVSFKFVKKYIRNNALNDYALCRLIGEYSNKYQTKIEMSNIKDNLYGISVYGYQDINCDNTTLNFTYHFLNSKYGASIDESLAFIKETLLNLYLDQNIVDEIKYNYEAKISRNLDNPSRYTNNRLIQIIGQNNHLKNRDIDLRYLLDDLSVSSILENYKNLIDDSDLYIYVIGDVDLNIKDKISTWFKSRLNKIDYTYQKLTINNLDKIIEEKELSQTYLRVVYNTGYSNINDNYYKWMVADALLGASSNALLFKEVREKHSLCYSIGSALLKSEGLMIVSSAISYADLDEVLRLIDMCIDILIKQDYDLNELEITKELLINSLLSNNDDAKNYIDFIHSNHILKKDYTIDSIIELIRNVSANDVSDVMKTYQRSLVYVLKGDQDGNN